MKAIGAGETGIARVAVIGAGAMGGGIAAQFANAGIAADLLDIPGADDRSGPAKAGIARQLKIGGFMSPSAAALVRPGNTEDDLARLTEADWVVEAVSENADVKRALFAAIAPHLKPTAILSSNTSTIPLADLSTGMDPALARRFFITHFFNPPRVMPLLESVAPPAESAEALAQASRVLLGKTVIDCRDTPGFIANRIGCYWLAFAALEAVRRGIPPETADAVHAALGIPRTGVFGLLDLIGIDLIPTVWGSLLRALPATDALHSVDLPAADFTARMLASGYLGRKAGAGFYRKAADGAAEVLDLDSFTWRPLSEPAALPKNDPAAMVAAGTPEGEYARAVLAAVLDYAARHAPVIAADPGAIDAAMELGYSWRQGPFALARAAGLGPVQATARRGPGLRLDNLPAILRNDFATLHDMGDGVACFRVRTKMNALAPGVFDLLEETLPRAGRDFRALVIGNEDPRAFSAGADLSFFLGMAEAPDGPARIEAYGRRGQRLFTGLLRAPVPVVAAVNGFTLGGGCEFQMHCDRTIAHAEVNIGLPETGVGLVPGWGGCTRLLERTGDPARAFATLFGGTVCQSAAAGREAGLLRADDGFVMHRDLLLPAAKAAALALVPGYTAPAPAELVSTGAAGRDALLAGPHADAEAGRISATDLSLAETLADILTNGRTAGPVSEADMLARELQALVTLAARPSTRERMAHMLKTGKRLKN
ncbi:3-hydroxyacyl-CoA dehydrogenase/enoyl-CoA hydratase family protein [Paracoccus panacisoli]|uniref:3-hydroxyacyl-CoA dehydrogenase/enoyl-CoA hydratase family protein n=1 Tax=Paracoccus panacisoli TaxID=1510163 RepID=A0ABV6T6Y6_9RHOB